VHPILESRRRLALYLVAWLPIAAVVAVILRRGTFGFSLLWLEALIVAIPMCLAYAFMCLSAWYLCRAVPIRDQAMARLLTTLAAASLISSALWFALGQTWTLVLEPWAPTPGLSERYGAQFIPLFLNGALLFLLAAAAQYLLITFDEARQVEKRALEMQILAREAELKALRAQIDPHFLFNSLNSISALSVSDPPGARRMCLLLADFLRTSLLLGTKSQISVVEELKLVDHFLDIEKVRYGPRLSVTRNIDSRCNECMVPPLLIQPLVENAVRHGIAKLVDGGTLRIGVQRQNNEVEILLENPIDEGYSTEDGAGVGLQNVRGRLANMFSNEARVDVSRQNGQFSVRLRFPCAQFGGDK
jgi:two-component system, LytTR family, sensor histidine kinase AlgZ